MVNFTDKSIFEFKGRIVNKKSGNGKDAHITVGPCIKESVEENQSLGLDEYKCLINMNNLYDGCPEYAVHVSLRQAFETAEDFVKSGLPSSQFDFYDQLGNKIEFSLSNFREIS